MDDIKIQNQEKYDRLSVGFIKLSFVWLILLTLILPHQGPHQTKEILASLWGQIALTLLLSVWSAFVFDYILLLKALPWRRKLQNTTLLQPKINCWERAFKGLMLLLFPAFRISMPIFENPNKIWLPKMGWQIKNHALEKRVSKAFGAPMIFIVLLVLPIMAIEHFKEEWLQNVAGVRFFLNLGTQVIWIAFAIEFIVLISLTPKKLNYCKRNILAIAIIILPLVIMLLSFLEFLGFLPILRLMRLTRLVRTTRMIRLRGAGIRVVRALTVLSITQRFSKRYYEKRVSKLRQIIAEKEGEIEELREEIEELENEHHEQQKMLKQKEEEKKRKLLEKLEKPHRS